MRTAYRLVLLGFSLALLAGCGAGAGSPGAATSSTTPSRGTGRAVFKIDWPPAPPGRLIPAATQSIGIVVSLNVVTAATQVVDRPAAGGQSVITLNNLPSGALTDTVTAYPQAGGLGTPLALGSSPVTITAGQSSAVALTLASSIDHLVVTPAAPMVIGGDTLQLMATAVDASGAMVLTAPGDLKWSSAAAAV
ncbi:MAG TPA: hypothetical protein VFJ58_10400, partial [Armatimonadota bacterium]|nr:hypothetical protein [Armatimonadota bacterium]